MLHLSRRRISLGRRPWFHRECDRRCGCDLDGGYLPTQRMSIDRGAHSQAFPRRNVRIATVYHNDSDYQQKHTYDVEHLGSDLSVVQSIAEGFTLSRALAQSKNPLILYGAKILQDEDSTATVAMLRDIEAQAKAFSGTSSDVLNCIQPSASKWGRLG